jgi:hypothetical protein
MYANMSVSLGRFSIGAMAVDLHRETGTGKFYYVTRPNADRMYVFPDSKNLGKVVVGMVPNLTISPALPT